MTEEVKRSSRREFLKKGTEVTVCGLGAIALSSLFSNEEVLAESSNSSNGLVPFPESIHSEEVIIRMQNDVRRALNKPLDQIQWTMVIDLKKCVGCSSCTVACISENVLPPGVVYRPVLEEEGGSYPNVTKSFLPKACMQCSEPACTKVCPKGATYKSEDGIVEINYDKCVGCKKCIRACPYNARSFDQGGFYTEDTPKIMAYEKETNYEYGSERSRVGNQAPVGKARKCHFCKHRLMKGMLPACVTTCIGKATYIGDKNDQESLVSELITTPRVMRLKEELGTEPNVYYLT